MRRAGLVVIGVGLAGLMLSGCTPNSVGGVPRETLDAAIGEKVGDPNTCVLLGSASKGGKLYEFGRPWSCQRPWPDCAGGERSAADLLKAVQAKGEDVRASCPSTEDGSRGVAWAAGRTDDPDIAYAAVMEGQNIPPGVAIADKLKAAFKKAGL